MLKKIMQINKGVEIKWNTELFKGMTYAQIQEFKNTNRELVLKQYKLEVKKAKIEEKLLQSRNNILKGGKTKKSIPQAITIPIKGVVVATVCLSASVAFANKSDSYIATNTVATSIVEEASVDTTFAEAIESLDVVVDENYYDIETTSEETEAEYTYSTEEVEYTYNSNENVYDSVDEFIIPSTEAVIEAAPIIEESTSIIEEKIEENYDDIVIFDKALEMLMNRCEASENGSVFKGEASSTFIPLMGNFILPSYEDMAAYKVAGWFEAYFGSEVTTYNLKYNNSFSIREGGVQFENTLEGFKVYIDKNAVEASVNLDLQDAEDASKRAGVSQQLRDYLISEECQQFLPSMYKIMSGVHSNVKSDLLESDEFYNTIKSSIETELKDLTTWDVQVVFN